MVLNSSMARWLGEPMLGEPNAISPGRFFASAISSLADFTGIDGCTTMTLGKVAILAIATRSFSRS